MKHLARNWRWLISIAAIGLLVSAGWWQFSGGGVATAQSQEPDAFAPVTAVERDAILHLFEAMNLDRDALVALNLTEQQAINLLSAGRIWAASHQAELANLETVRAEQHAKLRRLEIARRMGQTDIATPEALASARATLATAQAAWNVQLDRLGTVLRDLLSPSQVQTLQTIATGWGRAMPIRMVALTAEQHQDYGAALRRYQLRLASAADAAGQRSAAAAWQADLDRILTPDNQQVIDAYGVYAPDSAIAVRNAINTVLHVAEPT